MVLLYVVLLQRCIMSDISGVTNRDDEGRYSWEKNVVDVNNIDESFATARDLGYTRLNYARVTAVSSLDKYDSKDTFRIQLQSNGKLTVSLKSGDANKEKVLDLSEYDKKLEELKQKLDPIGYAQEQIDKLKKEEEADIFDDNAPGMYMKIYMVKNGKEVLIADSTAEKGSELRENAEAIMSGDYKAKKGNYFIETGYKEDAEVPKDGTAYAIQVLQGSSYKHDYVLTESKSADSKNEEITDTKDLSLSSTATGAYGVSTISGAYAAQIIAQSGSGAANMLVNGYLNVASLTADKANSSSALFSCLLDV